MAEDTLPGTIQTGTRDEERDRYREDYSLFVPGADVGPGTQPYVDASLAADGSMVLYADAVTIGNGTNLDTSTGTWLKKTGLAEDVQPLPPAGATGYVIISASLGGTTIFADDELVDQNSGLRYKITVTALYANNSIAPVAGIDTGEETNVDAGTPLTFTSPRPGCVPIAIVFENSDGSGLTGGRSLESEDQYRQRIKDKRANPPASGNDAEYQRLIEDAPGIGIQKAFTYPAVFGPGTTAFTFTLRPAAPGAGRIPNGAQINTIRVLLQDNVPADDEVFAPLMVSQPLTIIYRVAWANGAVNWADAPRWPAYGATGNAVLVQAVPSATITSARVAIGGGDTIADPQVGQSIGFYDYTTKSFVRKRIAALTIITPGVEWQLDFDTMSATSDTAFEPQTGAVVSPWSDSLSVLITPTLEFVDTTGPGEMFASFGDPGMRQRRNPLGESQYYNAITTHVIQPILNLSSISNALVLEPDLPYSVAVGVPGTTVYLFELTDLGAYGF